MKITNKSKYPIVLVNKVKNNMEQNFSLSLKYEKNDKIDKLEFIKQQNNCFEWQR